MSLDSRQLATLAQQYGTPLWVYDADVIRDRIAQLLVQRVELVDVVEVSSFHDAGLADTSRGDGGHGSSGGHASL